MSTYPVNTPGGVVTVEAESCAVDDSGHLGFFDADGKMVATFWAGEWSIAPAEPPPSNVVPIAAPVVEPAPPSVEAAPVAAEPAPVVAAPEPTPEPPAA